MQNSASFLIINSQRHACVTLYKKLKPLMQNAEGLSVFYAKLKPIHQKQKSPLARAFLKSFELCLTLQQAQHVLLRRIGLCQHRC